MGKLVLQSIICLICYEGSCEVNGKIINELEYADIQQNKEYNVKVNEDFMLLYLNYANHL